MNTSILLLLLFFILKTLRGISFNKWDYPLEIKIIDLRYFSIIQFVSDYWGVGLMGCRTIWVSAQCDVRLLWCRTYGASE